MCLCLMNPISPSQLPLLLDWQPGRNMEYTRRGGAGGVVTDDVHLFHPNQTLIQLSVSGKSWESLGIELVLLLKFESMLVVKQGYHSTHILREENSDYDIEYKCKRT